MRKLVLAAAILIASTAGAQSRTVVTTTASGNSANLSGAIRVGDMLYISGQLPNLRAPADTSIGGQTKSALEKIKSIADSAGTKMENVVKCTVFLINGADFQGMNAAYREFWPKDPPTRSTVVVAALVSPGAKLEVECLATYVK
jgi:2-iminobutanoate/2-iminopropanoate deaminase